MCLGWAEKQKYFQEIYWNYGPSNLSGIKRGEARKELLGRGGSKNVSGL